MALTVKRIPNLLPGKHADGHGLYCVVTPTGGRSYAYRYERQGRERWHGLGPTHTFTLHQARAAAMEARQMLWKGIDPIDAKKAQRTEQVLKAAKSISFKDAAKQYFDQHKASWSSVKHAKQFWVSLEMYAFPVIGSCTLQPLIPVSFSRSSSRCGRISIKPRAEFVAGLHGCSIGRRCANIGLATIPRAGPAT